MNLYINSPAYYSQFCCTDDDIYSFCLKIRKNIDITQYTQNLESIGITPIIAPLEELEKGKWGEIKMVSKKYKYADISLQIDYVKYSLADISNKKKLILDNIISSLYEIKKRMGNDFNFDKIKEDIIAIVCSDF